MRELLFSLTKKDFDVSTFRCGGKGGQKQNKTNSGVRLVHRASGAIGESRRERQQSANKKIAFRHLINSDCFKVWHKQVCSELMRGKTVEQEVDEMMEDENLIVEYGQ